MNTIYYKTKHVLALAILLAINTALFSQKGQEILNEFTTSGAYLPDFSYAGYQYGKKLPNIPTNVTTFKAINYDVIADDGKDDSEALKALVQKANIIDGPVVIQLPVGRVILSEVLYFERSNIILNGTGTGAFGSEIYCPRPLSYLKDPKELKELREYLVQLNKYEKDPEKNINLPYSQYSWTGGFLWTRVPGVRVTSYLEKYATNTEALALVASAQRGALSFEVDTPENLAIGDIVELQSFNKDGKKGGLISELYGSDKIAVGGNHYNFPNLPYVRQQLKIKNIEENKITVMSPLLIDIRPEFQSQLVKWEHLKEVGFQNFKITFPYSEPIAHHVEQGFNGFYLTRLHNSWVRNVVIENADSGILDESIANVTIEDVITKGEKPAHYTVQMGGVHNVLVKNLVVQNRAEHPLIFNSLGTKNVYTGCEVLQDGVLGQHGGANHQNLFDDIKVHLDPKAEYSYSLFQGGGAPNWRPSHGSYSTFWNINVHFLSQLDSNRVILLKGMKDGHNARILGVHGNKSIRIEYGPKAIIKGVNTSFDQVPSLYYFQLWNRKQHQNIEVVE